MRNTSLYCFIVNAANVTFLQVDPDSEWLAQSECSPALTTNSASCWPDVNATSLNTDGKVRPLLMQQNVSRKFLRDVEALCYPTVHMWCWIRSTNVEIPKYCDGFVLAGHVEFGSVFSQLSSENLVAFAARHRFQACNSHAVLEPNKIHKSTQGLSLKFAGVEVPVFTGERTLAKNISPSKTGYVKGIERSLIETLQDRFNFTITRVVERVPVHFMFQRLENEPNWRKNSSIGLVVRKKAVLIYGDLTLTHPRQHFIDYTVPHLSEGITIMAKVSLRSMSGRDLLFACGPVISGLYASSAVLVGLTIYVRTRFRVRISSVLFYVTTLVFQQWNRPPFRLCKMNRVLDKVWRLNLFVLGCWFSARLVQCLARGHIDGMQDGNEADLIEFLVANKDVLIFHDPKSLYLDDVQTTNNEIFLKQCRECIECHEPFLKNRIAFMISELSRIRRLFWSHMQNEPVFIMKNKVISYFLAFAVPKGCFLREHFNANIRAVFEAGIIQYFKGMAGLEARNSIPVKLRRNFGVRTSSNLFVELFPWLLLSTSVVFSIELLVARWRKIRV